MTINKELHPQSEVTRIYANRMRGGRGLINFEDCIKGEEKGVGWYAKHSRETLLRRFGKPV